LFSVVFFLFKPGWGAGRALLNFKKWRTEVVTNRNKISRIRDGVWKCEGQKSRNFEEIEAEVEVREGTAREGTLPQFFLLE